jgi:dTDP-4-dehydrorhamnose reductase
MYTEDDASDALDLYGRTKFLGETSGEGALTVRTSLVGREVETKSGLVEWFLAQRGGQVKGYRRAIFTGLTTERMCHIVVSLLRDLPELHGTIHVSSDPISKYELLLLLREAYDIDVDILADDEVQVDRSLDSTRFRRLTGFIPPSWSEMVQELAADRTTYDRWHAQISD